MARDVLVRPAGTSWGAIFGGWLAAVGVAAILTPLLIPLLANTSDGGSYASTVPILLAVALSYLIGGHVAARAAGYRPSWHGLMTAVFGLFVLLALIVVGVALSSGALGTTGTMIEVLPAILGITLYRTAETFAFGGALSFLIAIFAGWLGGLLAPIRHTAVVEPAAPSAAVGTPPARGPMVERRDTTVRREAEPVRREPEPTRGERERAPARQEPRRRFGLFPVAARKGGERVAEPQPASRAGEAPRAERDDDEARNERIEERERVERR